MLLITITFGKNKILYLVIDYCSKDSLRDKNKPVKKNKVVKKSGNMFNMTWEKYGQGELFGEK